jgi:4'-phosphopantetheinyl transferase
MPDLSQRSLVVHCAPVSRLTPSDPGVIDLPGANDMHLWFATLDSLRPRQAELNDLLDPVEQERAQRFRFDADRERFILGHGLLRSLLGKYLKRDGSLVRMARGPFGKPYLEGKDLRFSFSDTKDAILIAFANAQEIGADIETMHRSVDHDAVSGHYFTPTEIKAIQAAGSAAASKRRFLEYWTRKEAVLKASGVGIMDDLRSLRVDGERNTMTIAHEAFVSMAAQEYHVRTWHVGADHLISLASPEGINKLNAWAASKS